MGRNAKFKIWATIWWGYKYVLDNPRLFFRFCWLPILMTTGIFVSITYEVAVDREVSTWWRIFVAPLIGSYLAVRWHRAILLNEMRPRAFRIGLPEVFYFSALAVVGVIDVALGFLHSATEVIAIKLSLFVSSLSLILYCLIIIVVAMTLPAIAIRDGGMSISRLWKLWSGNRVRFFLFVGFSGLICSGVFYLCVQANSALSVWLAGLFNVDHGNITSDSINFAKFMLSFEAGSPILATIIIFLASGGVGALSLSFAGTARKAIQSDSNYLPPEALRKRLAT